MYISNDVRLNVRTSKKIRELLEQQAIENGMNMSAYISHLVLQVEKNKQTIDMMNNIINKMPQLDLQTMSMLIQNKGNEK
jgi:hypothetical protein